MTSSYSKMENKNIIKTVVVIEILIILIFGIVFAMYSSNRAEEIKLKKLLCEDFESTFLSLEGKDYCYAEFSQGIIMVEIIEECFDDYDFCQFKFKE